MFLIAGAFHGRVVGLYIGAALLGDQSGDAR
jgi:hypothetical protein